MLLVLLFSLFVAVSVSLFLLMLLSQFTARCLFFFVLLLLMLLLVVLFFFGGDVSVLIFVFVADLVVRCWLLFVVVTDDGVDV